MRSINPYIVGNPIKEQDSFYGRQDIFREVMQVLHQRESHAIVLYGQRRIGKTSMLLQLEQRLAREGEFTPIYFDLQDKASKSLLELLYELAQHISRVTGHTIQQADDFNNTSDYFRDTFLPGIASKVAHGGLVLLFDEFDVLDSPSRTQASQAFFPYLRTWMENVQNIKFIFVIGRRPEELSVRSMSTFKGIQSTRVSFMTQNDTESVIRQSERTNSLVWKSDAVSRIYDLTHGHPYFTQLLCSVVWENNHEDNEDVNPVATMEEVDKAVEQALKMGANAFNWLWDGLPPAERVTFSAMAEVKGEIIIQDQLVETLNQSGVRLIARELEIAPETLIDWELLYRADDGYRFSVPLLRRWVMANRPLRRVKDELDRLDPLADTLFQAGQGFYNSNRLSDAEQQLRQALNINPNHLKARLLLGRVYLDQNKLNESVEILEAAYQYDERAARADLLKSLLALVNIQSQDEAKQLETLDRILVIQPEQPLAREKRYAIWLQRGDEAFEKGDFDKAAKAYELIAHQPGIDKVIVALRDRTWQDNTKIANTLVSSQQYKEALDIYDKLISDYPEKQDVIRVDREHARAMWRDLLISDIPSYIEDEKWEKVVDSCEALLNQFPEDTVINGYLDNARLQLNITRKYNEGLGALEKGMQDQARKLFAEILSDSSAFGQASLKLVESMYGKVKISFPVPFTVTLSTFITSTLWTIIPVLFFGNWLYSILIGVLNSRFSRSSYGYVYVYIEDFFIFGLVMIPLVGALISYYANGVIDAAYQVERGKYSYRKAFWAHAVFGLGLFYTARESKRKWLYAIIATLIPATILAGIIYAQFASREFSSFKFSDNSEMMELWPKLLGLLLFGYALSFIDVWLTCRQKLSKFKKSTVSPKQKIVSKVVADVIPTETFQPIGWKNSLLLLSPLLLAVLPWFIYGIYYYITTQSSYDAQSVFSLLLLGFFPVLLLAKGDPKKFNWWKLVLIIPLLNVIILFACYFSFTIWSDDYRHGLVLQDILPFISAFVFPLGNVASLMVSNRKYGNQTFQTWLLFNFALSGVVGLVAAIAIDSTSYQFGADMLSASRFGLITPLIILTFYFSMTEFRNFSLRQKIALNISGLICFVVLILISLGSNTLGEVFKFSFIVWPLLAGILVALLYKYKYEQIISIFRRKS